MCNMWFWKKEKINWEHWFMITTAVSEVSFAISSVTKTVLYDSANFKPGTIELEALIMIYESYSGGDFQQEMTYHMLYGFSRLQKVFLLELDSL